MKKIEDARIYIIAIYEILAITTATIIIKMNHVESEIFEVKNLFYTGTLILLLYILLPILLNELIKSIVDLYNFKNNRR